MCSFKFKFKNKSKILDLAKSIRQLHPYMGCRKIYAKIKPELRYYGIKIGRDRLFYPIQEKRHANSKRNTLKTTNNNHWFKVYKNLVKGKELTHP